jgi:hypothetical protein
MADGEILVVAAPYSAPVTGEKALVGFKGPVQLNVTVLSENLKKFVDSVNGMIAGLPKVGEPFRLEEIELSVEVNAEGNFQLIGGAKAGVTGGLTLKLRRSG